MIGRIDIGVDHELKVAGWLPQDGAREENPSIVDQNRGTAHFGQYESSKGGNFLRFAHVRGHGFDLPTRVLRLDCIKPC